MAWRGRRPRMTVEEAERILAQVERGRLDTSDRSIARAVGEANRVLVRAETWGRDRAERRRTAGVVVAVLSAVALFVLGLTAALALTVVP